MIIRGIDNINTDFLSAGDIINLKIVSDNTINNLLKQAEFIGCKLIMLNYGQFYLRECRTEERDRTIEYLLDENN